MKRRRLLIEDQTAVYHVVSRTVCRRFLFSSVEKEMFRRLLRQQALFAGVEVLAFCVMSNHFHLLVRVPLVEDLPDAELLARYAAYYGESKVPRSTFSVNELRAILAEGGREAATARKRVLARMGNLPAFMRELKQRFSIWYNHRHDNEGTIWSARYRSLLVEDSPECLSKVSAYIDLNPVRAEIVDDPKDYRWCGYAEATAGVADSKLGIARLFGNLRDYQQSVRSYRLILYGKGYALKSGRSKEKGRIRAETLEALKKMDGKLPITQLLQARIRYFTDGMVLGSELFVKEQAKRSREISGSKRKQSGVPLTETCWGGLHVMRNLRRGIYS